MFDYSKLRGRIKEKYGSEYLFAARISLTAGALSAKFSNKADFTQKQILNGARELDIPDDEITQYFFCWKS